MKVTKKHKAFTLFELVLAVVILGVCVIPISLMYQQAMYNKFQVRVRTVAVSLAQEKIEEILNENFSSIINEGPITFSSPFSDYSYTIDQCNVNAGHLNNCVGASTDYKRVEVSVSHSALGSVVLVSLVTNN